MPMFMLAVIGLCVQAPLGPALASGSAESFQRLCLSVEEKLQAGDFAGAKKLAALLPKVKIRIEWDDSKVPAKRRAEFAEARDRALSEWARFGAWFKYEFGKPADIKVTFVPSLPPNADTPIAAGAVFMFSEDPKDPRLEAVIALSRGVPAEQVEAIDVHNEFGYALAAYSGLARSIANGVFSFRTELPNRVPNLARPIELRLSSRNIDASEKLRQYANSKTRVTPAKPQLLLEPLKVEGGSYLQGETPIFSLQLTNVGNAPLHITTVPDCGCLVSKAPSVMQAGDTAVLKVAVDTTEFVGQLKKRVILYANDAMRPIRHIPIELYAKPLYRLLCPTGTTVVVGPEGGRQEVYLVLPDGVELEPQEVRVDGISGAVAFGPWSGVLADPDMNEGAMQRKGYKFTISYGPDAPPGRLNSTLLIRTNSQDVLTRNAEKFEVLTQALIVQKGIVALPEQLRLGEISNTPRRFFFLLSRPGKPFKIRGVDSGSPFLDCRFQAVREQWEYRITVEFDGKAGFGLLKSSITIKTDDPSQKEIAVPFDAIVR